MTDTDDAARREALNRLRDGINELSDMIPRKAYDDVGSLKGSLLADLDELSAPAQTAAEPVAVAPEVIYQLISSENY